MPRDAAGPPSPAESVVNARASVALLKSAQAATPPSVLWDNTGTGEHGMWLLANDSVSGWLSLGSLPTSWRIVATGDFTGDGQSDVVWENTSTGVRGIWRMNANGVVGWTSFGGVPTSWHIVGAADFNHDGHLDLLWHDLTTGQVGIWRMHGTTVLGWTPFGGAPTTWRAVGVGDFTGEGDPDVLWEDTAAGGRGIWRMSGMTVSGWTSFGAVPISWHIVGAADMDVNGQIDVLWTDSATGLVGYWSMTGTTVSGWTPLGAVPSIWSPRATFVAGSGIVYQTHGINFSPYITGQNPNFGSVISEDQLRDRIQLVAPYTKWIRTFGMTSGLQATGRLGHERGLKVACGAWLGPNSSANSLEIANLITAVNAGECDMAIVGSEALLRNDVTESQLLGYMQTVKSQIPASIPMGTADVYGVLLAHPAVIAQSDVILPNIYPYWESVGLSNAVALVNSAYNQLVAVAGGKPIVISEAGWPSCGDTRGAAVPSPANASTFFLNFVSWARARNVPYFYFSGLDELWKASTPEGAVGACWGLMDPDGVLKPGMWSAFAGNTVPDNWSGLGEVGGPGTPSISYTTVPALGSTTDLQGQVLHVVPANYRVAVYIKVGSGWWTKPTAASPVTTIFPDGTWTCDVTTGGNDTQATEITAYLIPSSYTPPLLLGAGSLPAALDQNSVAKVTVTR